MTVDEAMSAYNATVAARQQAEASVILASIALSDATGKVDDCKLAEEVALAMLGIAVGVPSEKLVISARGYAALAEAQKSAKS